MTENNIRLDKKGMLRAFELERMERIDLDCYAAWLEAEIARLRHRVCHYIQESRRWMSLYDLAVEDAKLWNNNYPEALEGSVVKKSFTTPVPVDLIWMATHQKPSGLENWEYYRIEYGGHAMDCVYEGSIFLPPGLNPDAIEELFKSAQGELHD